ncbi:hypothetical protein D3C80_1937690 [compost metagenome]
MVIRPDQRILPREVIRTGKPDDLFAFIRHRHGRDDQVDAFVLHQRNAVFRRRADPLDVVFRTRQPFGQHPCQFSLEALDIAGHGIA